MKQLISMLTDRGLTLATAESCTGGLLSGAVTSVAGASWCFEMGVVTYSNRAKSRLIGVGEDTLKAYGAVSAQTAVEMAEGVLALSGADIALSVTGIAGPGGGTAQKPVGLVYIGVAGAQGAYATENHFSGNRDQVRQQTVERATALAKEYLTKPSASEPLR